MSELEELKFELSALNEKMDNVLSAIKKSKLNYKNYLLHQRD